MKKLICLIGIFVLLISCGQKSTKDNQSEELVQAMKDITLITTALVDYITDFGTTPSQDGIYDSESEFYNTLCPFYVKELPIKDPWGNNYRVYCGKAAGGKYGMSDSYIGEDDFIVVSYGSDGEKESWLYDETAPEKGIYFLSSPDDFNKDLIMFSGTWIRGPEID